MKILMRVIGENVKFHVEANPTDTVGQLKEKVRSNLRGMKSTDKIQLLFNGDLLADDTKLSQIINNRFEQFIGVKLPKKVGFSKSSITTPSPAPSTTLQDPLTGATPQQVRPSDGEQNTEDIFEMFRHLTAKYHRICGRQTPPNEEHAYASSWSFDVDQLAEMDTLTNMGFPRSVVVQVYVACERKIDAAANLLWKIAGEA